MSGYLVSFSLYTLAMIGVIFCALVVYKKLIVGGGCFSKKEGFLAIEETISINPRKSLLVVKAGNQKFLIASDVDRTSLISALDDNSEVKIKRVDKQKPDLELPINFDDDIINFQSKLSPNHKAPMMKELARKIRG